MKLNFNVLKKKEEFESSNEETLCEIVLIDDEEVNLEGISGILEKRYRVHSFLDAQEALTFIENNPQIKLVISDHIMPNMTGLELLTKINQLRPSLLKILVTGFAALENVIQGVNEAEIHRYITKPIQPDAFLKTIDDSVQLAIDRDYRLHLQSQLRRLLYPHQINQIRDLKIIEETMPIGSSEAVVISFDIQNSSDLGHSEHHDFFESVLKRCYQESIASYSAEKMTSNGFVIKEMGDGFLCSVGFPFGCDGSREDAALQLAENFVRIFKKVSQETYGRQVGYCAIGVASGTVIGKFPKIGPAVYDVLGEGIVKAKRYEEMRKTLREYNIIPSGNIIIVHEVVIEKASAELKNHYTGFELGEIKVRNDQDAKKLFFKILT